MRIRVFATFAAVLFLTGHHLAYSAEKTDMKPRPVLINSRPPGTTQADLRQIMRVSQIRRGMRGYGLTVFQGTKIEKFDVEILGILAKANIGHDLILVRIGGGIVTSRATGIIAGMSGSPCYIDGKLIGAISYGNSFSKEPIGMITPITDMLEAFDENLSSEIDGYSSPKPLPEKLTVGGSTFTNIMIDRPGTASDTHKSNDGTLHMQALMTPLVASGFSSRGLARLAKILEPFHLMPVAGGNKGNRGQTPISAITPGGAFGVSLATGDIDLTAVGTVTYCRDGMMVGFGHPFLGIGAVDAPITTAYVEDVFSGYEMSFKMATPGAIVGRIFQDRPWSVAGKLGEKARMVPISVSVNDKSAKRSKTYNISVIDHPLLAPTLAAMMTSEAIFQERPTPGDATAVVTCEIEADGIGKIVRTNTFFDSAAIDGASVSDMMGILNILANNRFRPVDIKSVSVNVVIENKHDTVNVENVYVKKSEYEPGENVDVCVVFRPYVGEKFAKTYQIKVPATASDSRVLLLVKGGSMSGVSAGAFAGDSEEERPSIPGIPGASSDVMNAENTAQMIRKYLEHERNDQLLLQLILRGNAVNIAGETLNGLPSPIADAMRSARTTAMRMDREDAKATFDVGKVVSGAAQIAITIKSKSTSDAAAPSPGGMPGFPPPPDAVPMSALGGAHSPEPLVSMAVPTAIPSIPTGEDDASSPPEPPGVQEDDAPPMPGPSLPDVLGTSGDEETDGAKPVIRELTEWVQKTQVDFDKGKGEGIAVSSKNRLEIVPTLKLLSETSDQFVWRVLPEKNGCIAGTGTTGRVYRVSSDGSSTILYETGELLVHDLARDSKGNIYVATSPNGKIFVISPNGVTPPNPPLPGEGKGGVSGKLFCKLDERYPLCMVVDDKDNLYVGVGDAGKVYRIDSEGRASVFVTLPEQQVLSLAWDNAKNLLAGTGIGGVVYRIDPSGTSAPVFDAPETSITALVCDSKGVIYAASGGKGPIYRIGANGVSEVVNPKPTSCLSLAVDRRDNIFAACDDGVIRISPDKTITPVDFGEDNPQFLCISVDKETGALYAGTGNVGAIYGGSVDNATGTYTSQVHDSKNMCKWGAMRWTAEVPEGCEVSVQTRTGAKEKPDSMWTDWSAPYDDSSGTVMSEPNGRYIQYKVTMKASSPELRPVLSSVCASYLTPNQKPTVKITAPVGSDAWARKKKIKWAGSDPDKDNLTYDVAYSGDGGKSWIDLKDEPVASPKADKKPKSGSDEASGPRGPRHPELDSGPKSATSHDWDTAKVPDGSYELRVKVNDRASNPDGFLEDEFISDPFVVCNTPPDVIVAKKTVELSEEGPVTLEGATSAKLLRIDGVQFKVDNGEWMAAAPVDGIYDSRNEVFRVVTLTLEAGEHKLEIKAIDMAGNARVEVVTVTVGPAKPKEGKS